MISLRKFNSLPSGTRQRKLWRILYELELALRADDVASSGEILDFLQVLVAGNPELAPLLAVLCTADNPAGQLWAVNDCRHRLATVLGQEAAEWDLFPPLISGSAFDCGGVTPTEPNLRRLVYLDDIRSPFNAGSIFRSASAFGMDGMVLSPDCPAASHPRFARSAMGAVDFVPWERLPVGGRVGLGALMERENLPCFALELGGVPLADFTFPMGAILVLGSEELGIHPDILELCRLSAGVVSIPMPGPKASLNVGVSFGIVAEHWQCRLPDSSSSR